MQKDFFIGVDGGGSKTAVRIEDATGHLLGTATGGPANIRLSVTAAWQSIYQVIATILQPLGLQLTDPQRRYYAGIGIAGCEIQHALAAFTQQKHPFTHLVTSSDAHVACLGAHAGRDGAVIIAGTGVVGLRMEQAELTQVSGWGFPHDDLGSGAWLGMEAVKHTFQYLDGRDITIAAFASAILGHFSGNKQQLIEWANQASSTEFAQLAPLVIQLSRAGDVAAKGLMQQAALHIQQIANALTANQRAQQPLPCTLLGGLATSLHPYLSADLQARLKPATLSPCEGAILLIKQTLAQRD